jgi:hypothetical protein
VFHTRITKLMVSYKIGFGREQSGKDVSYALQRWHFRRRRWRLLSFAVRPRNPT